MYNERNSLNSRHRIALDELTCRWNQSVNNLDMSYWFEFQPDILVRNIHHVQSVLFTTQILTKCLKKMLNGSYTRMLNFVFNKFWSQHPTKQQLYLPSIIQTILVRWTKHTGYWLRSKDELMSNVFLWTPTHVGAKAKTYIHQLFTDTGCRLDDLLRVMADRNGWQEKSSKSVLFLYLDDDNDDGDANIST